MALDNAMPTSLQAQWREHDLHRTELSTQAAEWMKAHALDGRLFHRCEDGGWLQQDGFDHGETFSDTGFGKYDEDFIHEVGLVNERPALLPRYLHAYQPDYVVCSGTFCYRWPFYLTQSGYRLLFYSPNSSAWGREGLRRDLATVAEGEIESTFARDLAQNGVPSDVLLLARNIIALNSLGREDFAFAKLTGLPREDHHAAWYWEAARFLCFCDPPFSAAHREALRQEAEALHDDALTADFRARAKDQAGDEEGALAILKTIPPHVLGNDEAELLLKIEVDRKLPGALLLAHRTDCFDLRNGRHWQYLAQAEEQAGDARAAGRAWQKAVFYYPDDAVLMDEARAFALKYDDETLTQKIAGSGRVYGAPER
jgi:hypothetical protein